MKNWKLIKEANKELNRKLGVTASHDFKRGKKGRFYKLTNGNNIRTVVYCNIEAYKKSMQIDDLSVKVNKRLERLYYKLSDDYESIEEFEGDIMNVFRHNILKKRHCSSEISFYQTLKRLKFGETKGKGLQNIVKVLYFMNKRKKEVKK